MKVKIVSPGWEKYSGRLGDTIFVDGVATNVTEPQAAILGANFRIIEIDADGNELDQISVNRTNMTARGISIQPTTTLPRLSDLQANAPQPEPPAPVVEEPLKVYTRQELETIADADGIKGLRTKAGDRLGVSARSISDMIDAILASQAKTSVPMVETVGEPKAEPVVGA